MKPSNRIFFFPSLPFLACHSVTHFKVPTVSVLHPSALFSRSSLRCPSQQICPSGSVNHDPWKKWDSETKQLWDATAGTAPGAFIRHFPSVPHSTGRLQKCTVFSFRGELPDLSISHPQVFSACQSGRATYWSPSKSKPLSACKLTETHRCSPLPPLAAILPPTPRPRCLLIFQSPFTAWMTVIGVSGVDVIG